MASCLIGIRIVAPYLTPLLILSLNLESLRGQTYMYARTLEAVSKTVPFGISFDLYEKLIIIMQIYSNVAPYRFMLFLSLYKQKVSLLSY